MKIFSKENIGGFTIAGLAIFVADWIKKILVEGGSKQVMEGLNKKESMRETRQLALNYIYSSNYNFQKLREAFENWNKRKERPYGSRTKYKSGFEDKASSVLTVAFSAFCNPIKEEKTGKVVIDKTGEEKYIKLLESLNGMSPEQRDNTIEILEYNWKSQAVLRFLEGARDNLLWLLNWFNVQVKKLNIPNIDKGKPKNVWNRIKRNLLLNYETKGVENEQKSL